MNKPKLILLDGFAGVGKTTVAERYTAEHPLALSLEEDKLIVMLGQWLKHEERAWSLAFKLSVTMIAAHLESGHDVVIPYLPADVEHALTYEEIARKIGAQFFEVVLTADREEVIQRLIQRGSWGEEGAPPITDADLPIIEAKYDLMDQVLAERPGAIRIPTIEGDHDGTYRQFLAAIGEPV